ncbi:hypothetical protein H6P81_001917 [Aristolochia fimbriata]|uniref:Uncharacterized protein n=1 Tax=Aristolochia fimbriata TaxID=158543 RepID=A0AAV7F8W5_ARIFI|nr:hypothetical protein H6P81_001917 [Aristolochia fimbriata]
MWDPHTAQLGQHLRLLLLPSRNRVGSCMGRGRVPAGAAGPGDDTPRDSPRARGAPASCKKGSPESRCRSTNTRRCGKNVQCMSLQRPCRLVLRREVPPPSPPTHGDKVGRLSQSCRLRQLQASSPLPRWMNRVLSGPWDNDEWQAEAVEVASYLAGLVTRRRYIFNPAVSQARYGKWRRAVRQQRGKFYIIKLCVSMLLCSREEE